MFQQAARAIQFFDAALEGRQPLGCVRRIVGQNAQFVYLRRATRILPKALAVLACRAAVGIEVEVNLLTLVDYSTVEMPVGAMGFQR